MTLPSFVASSAVDIGVGANGTSMLLTRPAAWVSGGVAYVALYKENNAAVTLPATGGWSQIATLNEGSDFWAYVFRKVLGGSEPTNYTWSWTGSAWREGGGISVIDADQTTPENVTPTTQANAESLNVTAPAITPNVANTLLVVFGYCFADETWTVTTGMTGRLMTVGRAFAIATETGPASGVSSGTNVFTILATEPNVGITVAVQEVQSVAQDIPELRGRPGGLRGERQMRQLLAQ